MKRRHGASAQQRRAALIDATVQVAAEHGMAGVTHRAVTERAGLPLATVGYFFDSITDLAVEALRAKVAEDAAAMNEVARALVEGEPQPLGDLLQAFAAAAATSRTDGLAFVEALLHVAREPELAEVAIEVIEAGRSVVDAATTAAGVPVADPGAFLALVHGYLLHSLAAPALVDPEALARGGRTMLIGALVEQGRLDQAVELASEGAARSPRR